MNVLLIGGGSFVARAWRAATRVAITAVTHDQEPLAAIGTQVVVNCALDPRFRSEPYEEAFDRDLAAARFAVSVEAHLVMLGSRKVYRPDQTSTALTEDGELGPTDRYGENKLESERRVAELLGERCTILRIGNIYGFEPGRRSFFGLAMTSLKAERRIVLDVSPFTRRDFIAVEDVAFLLDAICQARPAGIYNLGTDQGLELGRIAQWLIEGYGEGRLEVTDVRERDDFVLSPAKLLKRLGCSLPPRDSAHHIRQLGAQLRTR